MNDREACINHPQTPASQVPWWPYSQFLDVEGGVCAECAAGDCSDLDLLAIGSDAFWVAFQDMRASHQRFGGVA